MFSSHLRELASSIIVEGESTAGGKGVLIPFHLEKPTSSWDQLAFLGDFSKDSGMILMQLNVGEAISKAWCMLSDGKREEYAVSQPASVPPKWLNSGLGPLASAFSSFTPVPLSHC